MDRHRTQAYRDALDVKEVGHFLVVKLDGRLEEDRAKIGGDEISWMRS